MGRPPVRQFLPVVLLLLHFATLGAAEPHWAFRPRGNPNPPSFIDREANLWMTNALDAFILQQLRAKDLRPAPEADRATLIRRLSFDLTGLPPTLDEIDTFTK